MATNTPSSDPQDPKSSPEKPDSTQKKPDFIAFRSVHESKKAASTYDVIFDYVKENTKDSIAYIAMVVGIILMLFDAYSMYGSLAVGIVFSLYFNKELVFVASNVKDLIEEYGFVKSLVLGGTLFALFLKAPFVFIGMAIVTGVKMFVLPESSKP